MLVGEACCRGAGAAVGDQIAHAASRGATSPMCNTRKEALHERERWGVIRALREGVFVHAWDLRIAAYEPLMSLRLSDLVGFREFREQAACQNTIY
jgi:hypothetical protein